VSSLLGKCNSHEDLCRNEEQARNREERAGNSVAEGTGASAMAEDCIEGQQIKEVFVNGFSDASLDLSSMTSSYDCTKDAYDTSKDEEHSSCQKLVEEVMVLETNCKEFNEVSFDISSAKQHQEDTPVDLFVEEVASRELCTSCGKANLPHLQSGHEFVGNRKEAPACATSEILELIDKHETVAVVVTGLDNSEENRVNCRADFPDDILANKVPKNIFHEQQDTIENTVTDPINMLSEDHFIEEKGNQIIGISDETHDLNNESKISGLPLDSVSEKKCSTVATSNASVDHTDSGKKDTDVKQVTDNVVEGSGTTSSPCDSTENNQARSEEIGTASTDDNIHNNVASGGCSVTERTEDGDENSSTSEVVSAKQHY
jgi:hypothetical protein